MSNWVSVQFSNGVSTSVALWSDFYGMLLVKEAEAHGYYLRTLFDQNGIRSCDTDPGIMMFDFIYRVVIRKKMFRGHYTLRDGTDARNHDGCERHVINIAELCIRKTRLGRNPEQDVKDAAKELRKDLRQEFPETRFSVRVVRWRLGEGIFVRWEGGPQKEEVEVVARKYEDIGIDELGSRMDGDNRYVILIRKSSPESVCGHDAAG